MGRNTMGWENPETIIILADEVGYSSRFSLIKFKPSGFFSVEVELTGNGTLQLQYSLSNKLDPKIADFIKPTGISDIVTSHTNNSGPNNDGHNIYQFPVPEQIIFAKWVILKLIETASEDITVTIYPNVQ